MNHLEEYNILYIKQHGFQPILCWESRLVELISDILSETDNRNEVDACVLDSLKAFDKVNHHKLFLNFIGVSEHLSN